MNLEEVEGTRWALCFKDCQAFLQTSDFCIALCLAFLIWHNSPLALRLQLSHVLINCSLLLVRHLQICTAVCETDGQGFDLRLSTLDFSLLCGQRHLVLIHQLLERLQVLALVSCILFDRLTEFFAHSLENVHDATGRILLCTSKCGWRV